MKTSHFLVCMRANKLTRCSCNCNIHKIIFLSFMQQLNAAANMTDYPPTKYIYIYLSKKSIISFFNNQKKQKNKTKNIASD